ncbi:glycosyltransferase family 4 protein [Acinetobacter sp. 194]|uniref:glycosyltransferase family 4 protein n=1 Tax=Acinetobacter shaoyimingii TaxID=2715164 RepID=UPI00140D389C|nr:glycosyltransferase family 4 protein [Acinetobacter shaoyimingii]NHB58722.1 glycosyltransferase family 4 protein [Acinetobacter shaoyimingii]
MNVLILTNHFSDYTGSEIQALEVYKYFKDRNANVKILSNYFEYPLIGLVDKADIVRDIESLDLSDINLIWSQHTLICRLFHKIKINQKIRIVTIHLSSFEMLELASLSYMKVLETIFVANSEETRDKLIEFGLNRDAIMISHNCAPEKFCSNDLVKEIKKILVVSNHPPKELLEALKVMRKKYSITIFGKNNTSKLITPDVIKGFDCVITIGKTVQYSLLSNKIVYCYDHFGGPGFLNRNNYTKAKYYNFSGRGFEKKNKETIINDFNNMNVSKDSLLIDSNLKKDFILELFMDKVLNIPETTFDENKLKVLHENFPMEKKILDFYYAYRSSQKKIKRYRYRIKFLVTISAIQLILFLYCFKLYN